jgi:hypothetical protein
MGKMWSRSAITLLAATLMVSAGCAAKTVRQISDDPYRYSDREVSVSGRVIESFALASRGAYEIEDRTGRLWVISDQGVPRRDTRVNVKGRVRTAFDFGPLANVTKLPASLRSGLVLVESSRNVRD